MNIFTTNLAVIFQLIACKLHSRNNILVEKRLALQSSV